MSVESQAPPARVVVLRRRVLFVYAVLALALIPWTAYLTSSLQPKHVTTHWDILWPGFDVALVVAAAATALAVFRQSAWISISASVMGTLLLCDAWFDLWTSNPGSERWWAISEAVLAEAPLAVFSFWVAHDAELVGAAAQRYLEARWARTRASASSREP
jgi:hypothetical protein